MQQPTFNDVNNFLSHCKNVEINCGGNSPFYFDCQEHSKYNFNKGKECDSLLYLQILEDKRDQNKTWDEVTHSASQVVDSFRTLETEFNGFE